MENHTANNKLIFWAVLAGVVLMYLGGLGRRHLWNADEPRVAGVAAHMSNTGEFAVPKLNGRAFLEKPPLYFWSTAVTFNILGQNNFAARFPSALSAIGGVLLVYMLMRKMGFSALSTALAAMVCATSIEYWMIGRRCIIDMMLAFYITAAMACFYPAITAKKRQWLWAIGFVISLSLAVLTKGLIGLAIPASAIFFWLILEKDFSLRSWGLFIGGSILCFIPTAWWAMALCDALGKAKVYDVMIANNIGRFTGGHAEHVEPFYYYLMQFPGQFMPWALFLPLVFIICRKTVKIGQKYNPTLFMLCWFIVPLLLMTISSGKRGLYLLPLYPAAAMLVGQAIANTLENGPKTKWFTTPAFIVLATVILIPVYFLVLSIRDNQPIGTWPVVLIPSLALGAWAMAAYFKEQFTKSLRFLAMALIVAFVTHDAVIEPMHNDGMSCEPLMEYCAELQAEGKSVALLCPKERLSGAAVFYLKDTFRQTHNANKLLTIFQKKPDTIAITYMENLTGTDKVELPENFIIGTEEIEILNEFEIGSDTVVVIQHKNAEEQQAMKIGLRIDVDTFRGTKLGVPNLCRILDEHAIKGTFFFSVGPDNMGRHLWRLLKPAFLWKMLRTNAASLYGWDILFKGTFWPGPVIGHKLAPVIRAASDADHEIGLHAWDHHRWQAQIEEMDAEEIYHELQKGYDALTDICGKEPACSAVPGWKCTEEVLSLKERFSFEYNSDSRGETIFQPRIGRKILAQPQIPVTLPTYDEVIGRTDITNDSYNEYLLSLIQPDKLNVLTIHAEAEGIACQDLFVQFVQMAHDRGYTFVPLGKLLDEVDAIQKAAIQKKEIPGREGWVCCQAPATE